MPSTNGLGFDNKLGPSRAIHSPTCCIHVMGLGGTIGACWQSVTMVWTFAQHGLDNVTFLSSFCDIFLLSAPKSNFYAGRDEIAVSEAVYWAHYHSQTKMKLKALKIKLKLCEISEIHHPSW